MKKKILLMMLGLTMVVGVLAGCSSQTNKPNQSEEGQTTDGEKPGFTIVVSNAPVWVAIQKNVEAAAEAAGGKVLFEAWDYSPEGLIVATEKLVAAGVDGFVFIPPADTVIPKLQSMCEEVGVPFVMPFRYIKDKDIKMAVETSPMYVANSYENDEEIAYDIVKHLHENEGANNLAVLGLTKGDISGDRRDVGIEQACEELGVNLLAVTRGIESGDDATKVVESFIASYPELDSIFIVGGAVTPGSLQGAVKALETHNLVGKVKIGMIDFATGMGEEFDKGALSISAGGNMVADPTLSAVALINKIKGTPLSDEPITLKINMSYCYNKEDSDNYDKYVEGEYPVYTEEEFKNMMFKFENDSVTKETLLDIAQNWGLEDVMNRHKDLVK